MNLRVDYIYLQMNFIIYVFFKFIFFIMVKKKTERQESMNKYGTWFAKDATASEIVKKCDLQIEKYEKWKQNLEKLKSDKEKEAQEFSQKAKTIAESLDSLTEEERNAFLKNYKLKSPASDKKQE